VAALLERRKSALAETIELRKIVYITNQIESINFQPDLPWAAQIFRVREEAIPGRVPQLDCGVEHTRQTPSWPTSVVLEYNS
jgi:hypothetical protein